MKLTPSGFVKYIYGLSKAWSFPPEKLILGGDHLGPHVWQNQNAVAAMQKGCILVRDYVRSGYSKIHLDASMRCADDDPHRSLPTSLIAQRTAQLAQAAETAYAENPARIAPMYVIGTEVPTPGGALAINQTDKISTPEETDETIESTRLAFGKLGLQAAWERVMAVVVRPGVEFDNTTVQVYNPARVDPLRKFIEGQAGMVFEAHSTDFQPFSALHQMVKDHFAIVKVGPQLTFALREALFALEQIEQELLWGQQKDNISGLTLVLDKVLANEPQHWHNHFSGNFVSNRLAIRYGYSDRLRYYWSHPEVNAAVERLLHNLEAHPVPDSLLRQYLPNQFECIQQGNLVSKPQSLISAKIREVLQLYAKACGIS